MYARSSVPGNIRGREACLIGQQSSALFEKRSHSQHIRTPDRVVERRVLVIIRQVNGCIELEEKSNGIWPRGTWGQ